MIFIFDIYRLKLIAFDFNEGNNFCIGFYRTFDLDEGFETLMHLKCIKINMNIASTFYFWGYTLHDIHKLINNESEKCLILQIMTGLHIMQEFLYEWSSPMYIQLPHLHSPPYQLCHQPWNKRLVIFLYLSIWIYCQALVQTLDLGKLLFP